MLGFNELNYHSQQAVEYNDNRPSGVRYEGIPKTVTFSTVYSRIPAQPAPIDVLEIVNYETAAVTFQVRVQSKFLEMTQGTTFTFNLPPGITQELLAPGEYQFSGFRTADELDQVLSYAIKVPMDWPAYNNWYFENKISYYDSASSTTQTITWILGDPQFMPTAFITLDSAMAAAGIIGKPLAAAMATAFNFVFIPDWAKTFSAHAESEFIADVVVSDIGPFQSEVALVALGMSALEVTAQAFPLATVACIANGESGKEAFAVEPAFAVAEFAPTGNALFNAEAQPLSTAVLSATASVGQNSATAPIGSVYAEDTTQTLSQVFGAPGLQINSWRPEETYDFRITELQSVLPYVAEPERVTHAALDTSFNARTADHDPYTGRTVVACQDKNAYSDDNGATWTSYAHSFGTPLDLFFNRYRDEWVMTVGSVIYRSTDGVTFTQWYDHGSTSGTRRIAYSPVLNKYVVARTDAVWIFDADTAPVSVTVASGITINDIAYSAELNTLIVVGANGAIYTSVNAQSWTQRTSGTSASLNGVTWAGTQFVVVGSNATVLRSATGVTWTAASSVPAGTGWRRVAWHSATNTLMANAGAIFSGDRVMYSVDSGNTWTQLPLGTAMLDIKATQTGFILPSTTGLERAFSYNAVITPQFTTNYPRFSGTAAQIQTALGTSIFVAGLDQTSTVNMRARLTHAIARSKVYFEQSIPVTGYALDTFSTTVSAFTYVEDTPFNLGAKAGVTGRSIPLANTYRLQVSFHDASYTALPPREITYYGTSVLGSLVDGVFTVNAVPKENVIAALNNIVITPPWNVTTGWRVGISLLSEVSGEPDLSVTYTLTGTPVQEVQVLNPTWTLYTASTIEANIGDALLQGSQWSIVDPASDSYKVTLSLGVPAAGGQILNQGTPVVLPFSITGTKLDITTALNALTFTSAAADYQTLVIQTYQTGTPGDTLQHTHTLPIVNTVPAEELFVVVNQADASPYSTQAQQWRNTIAATPTVMNTPLASSRTYSPFNIIPAGVLKTKPTAGVDSVDIVVHGTAGALNSAAFLPASIYNSNGTSTGLSSARLSSTNTQFMDYAVAGSRLYTVQRTAENTAQVKIYSVENGWTLNAQGYLPLVLTQNITFGGANAVCSIAVGPSGHIAIGQLSHDGWEYSRVSVYNKNMSLVGHYATGLTGSINSAFVPLGTKIPMWWSKSVSNPELAFVCGYETRNIRIVSVSGARNYTNSDSLCAMQGGVGTWSTTGDFLFKSHANYGRIGYIAPNNTTGITNWFNGTIVSIYAPPYSDRVFVGTSSSNTHYVHTLSINAAYEVTVLSSTTSPIYPAVITSSPI